MNVLEQASMSGLYQSVLQFLSILLLIIKQELQLSVISINPTSITSFTLLLGTTTKAVDSITPTTTTLSAVTTGGATISSSSSVGTSASTPSTGAAVGRHVGLGGILGVGIVSAAMLI